VHKEKTILVPQMLPIHFAIFLNILRDYGYKVEILNNEGSSVVHEGLMAVHNDTCYPALLTTGQMMDALKSGKYDVDNVALLMTQTGGGCRASNYVYLIRKALKNMGMEQVPVLALNIGNLGQSGGFNLSMPMVRKLVIAANYGDLLMHLSNQVKPYEVNKSEHKEVIDYWIKYLDDNKDKVYKTANIQKTLNEIVKSFAEIEIVKTDKTKVGIVGEIYIKFSALGNNHLEDFLAKEDCEVMLPTLLSFLLYCVSNPVEDVNLYGGSKLKQGGSGLFLDYLINFETMLISAIEKHSNFLPPTRFMEVRSSADGIIGHGCKMGEGWLLTADMVDLIKCGYDNIVCAQPFGCLPNHVAGKGMIRKIKELYPTANIVPIDYDPGATKVNQENRIKLMLAVARENKDSDYF
jgi:predicted nucleotide-binding protein (sugar kinase/HSP70/actin superfamily)